MFQKLDITPSALPRVELLYWINTSIRSAYPSKLSVPPIKKVEQCGNGVPYVLLLPTMLPVPYPPLITKAKVPANHEFEAVINLKLIQETLHRNGIVRPTLLMDEMPKLISGNFQANLHLLQWFHGLYLALKEKGVENYQRKILRSEVRPIEIVGKLKHESLVCDSDKEMHWARENEQDHIQSDFCDEQVSDNPLAVSALDSSPEGSSSKCSQECVISTQPQRKRRNRRINRQEMSLVSADNSRTRPRSAPSNIVKYSTTTSRGTASIHPQNSVTPKNTPTPVGRRQDAITPMSRSRSVSISVNKAGGCGKTPTAMSSTHARRHTLAISFTSVPESNTTAINSAGDARRNEYTHAFLSSGLNAEGALNTGTHARLRIRRVPKLSITKPGALVGATQEQVSRMDEQSQNSLTHTPKHITLQPKRVETNNDICKEFHTAPSIHNSDIFGNGNNEMSSETLTEKLHEVTMEKHFYYDKLRMIESLILKELNSNTPRAVALANSIKEILYATK